MRKWFLQEADFRVKLALTHNVFGETGDKKDLDLRLDFHKPLRENAAIHSRQNDICHQKIHLPDMA